MGAGLQVSMIVMMMMMMMTYSVSLYTLYPGRAPPPGWSCVVNKTIEQILVCPTSGIYI